LAINDDVKLKGTFKNGFLTGENGMLYILLLRFFLFESCLHQPPSLTHNPTHATAGYIKFGDGSFWEGQVRDNMMHGTGLFSTVTGKLLHAIA
jgi:hypothetical protein